MMTKRVLIAAGGTGGHMFPAAAFASEMRTRGYAVTLVTDARGRQYAKDFPADSIEETPAATIQGLNPVKALSGAMAIARGVRAAATLLNSLNPAIVAGFGGYPSLPTLWAARMNKRPYIVHEQNAVLGRVNRAFAPDAAAVACGFERLDKLSPKAALRKVVTGNPVRPPIIAARAGAYPIIPAGGVIRLLAIGGSQGARLFGEVIPEAIIRLPKDIRDRVEIVQQARPEQAGEVNAYYGRMGIKAVVAPFFDDIAGLYAQAHLIIARAGASSVTEIAVVGRPSILVPLAIATDDHQTANADALAQVGAADVIAEAGFTPDALAARLAVRLDDPHSLSVRAAAAKAVGRPDAAKALADLAERDGQA